MQGKIKLKHGEDFYIKKLLKDTKVKEIMSPAPVSIRVDDHFREVPRKMNAHKIRHLPVVDKHNRVVGLLTERDVFKVCPPHKQMDGRWIFDEEGLNGIVLENVMVPGPFCLSEETSLGDALIHFAEKKYGCIPIVNPQGALTGIITQIDVLRVAAQIYTE